MKSTEFLQAAIDVQAERGVTYDKPTGERSMGATVTAFNAITGRDLSEAEGWLLLQTLKDVRQWQNPSKYHHDSALDGVAYSALKAEALSEENHFDPLSMPIINIRREDTASEWIKWNGGEPPLPLETDVDVKLEDGSVYVDGRGLSVDNWEWQHNHEGCNIIAYRVTPTSTAQ
jgi:hypothetical protein